MLNLAALNLKACWKRIPTMMDAFRGDGWLLEDLLNTMWAPKTAGELAMVIYIYNYMILYNSILMGL